MGRGAVLPDRGAGRARAELVRLGDGYGDHRHCSGHPAGEAGGGDVA
ncbi:MAG: hypothetical protein MZV64_73670 [Ignavibacteriales bacterium]|nr:hypothetical protein [Ignavibacteriales bacterium]